MPSCKEIELLIQLYVDGEIGANERQTLREHIETCASCRSQWEEMVSLVRNLEVIGNEERMRKRQTLLLPVKWTAVCASITLFFLISPVHSVPSSSPSLGFTTMQSRQMFETVVLATQAEKLHIPNDEYIQVVRPKDESPPLSHIAWIYPSAVPFLQNGDPSWLKKVNQLIFVRVPDMDTLNTLLATVGIHLHPDQLGISDLRFPTSVILKTGNHPQIETFQFPDNEQAVSRWFQKIATQATLQ